MNYYEKARIRFETNQNIQYECRDHGLIACGFPHECSIVEEGKPCPLLDQFYLSCVGSCGIEKASDCRVCDKR